MIALRVTKGDYPRLTERVGVATSLLTDESSTDTARSI